jgi:hypothetical protein
MRPSSEQSAAAVSSHDDSRASKTGTPPGIIPHTHPIHRRCKSAIPQNVYFFFELEDLFWLELEREEEEAERERLFDELF